MTSTRQSSLSGGERRDAFAPGTLVGERYRIVSALARGGFGAVYVAEQLATTRRVALKLLTSGAFDVSVDRLLAEARLACRVNSEHVVQIYDAGIDPDSSMVFVAMELLSGKNLAEVVRVHGPRSPIETAEYLRQVALGLDRVHGFVASDGCPVPIVHRDLKPANLFLTRREDGTAWLKILDFGAAKSLSGDVQSSGVIRGTPEFMAYEQAAGGEITPATDIWAFGLVAFSLLTGRSYWRGVRTESARAQVFAEILSLPLPAPSERAKESGAPDVVAPEFDTWFFRCVNRSASERWASAGEAARELARVLGVTARPVQVAWLEQTAPVRPEVAPAGAPNSTTRDLSGVAANSRRGRTSRFPLSAALVAVVALVGAAALFRASRHTASERSERAGSGARAVPHASELAPLPAPPSSQMASAASTTSTRISPSDPASTSTSSRPSDVPVAQPVRRPSPSTSAASSKLVAHSKHADPYDQR